MIASVPIQLQDQAQVPAQTSLIEEPLEEASPPRGSLSESLFELLGFEDPQLREPGREPSRALFPFDQAHALQGEVPPAGGAEELEQVLQQAEDPLSLTPSTRQAKSAYPERLPEKKTPSI